jgi:hypothetical protein
LSQSGDGTADRALTAADHAVLARLDEDNQWLRAFLCTLARRGTLLRQQEPERAARLIDALSRWPWFKGGQFLFDLMEWEDFMVDGPPPPLLSSALGSASMRRFARTLSSAQALMDDSIAAAFHDAQAAYEQINVEFAHAEEQLPDLQPGLYLYRDVVLGIVISAGAIIEAGQHLGDSLNPSDPSSGSHGTPPS